MNIGFKKLISPFLFWFHVLFIINAILVGLFVTPLVTFALVVLHRIHVIFFGECILSGVHRKAGSLPKDMDFLQLAAKKIFHKDISSLQSRMLDYSFACMAITIALIK
jgi:hypothetical protein